jgi:hypothetical protein
MNPERLQPSPEPFGERVVANRHFPRNQLQVAGSSGHPETAWFLDWNLPSAIHLAIELIRRRNGMAHPRSGIMGTILVIALGGEQLYEQDQQSIFSHRSGSRIHRTDVWSCRMQEK